MTVRTFTIKDLSTECDISPRTIRFYEEKGLIEPQRTAGNQRVYATRDRARLKLILRGKRLGFSLDQIAEMIGMATVDMDEREQIEKSIAYGMKKLKEIKQKQEELAMLEQDLLGMHEKLQHRLDELIKKNGPERPIATP